MATSDIATPTKAGATIKDGYATFLVGTVPATYKPVTIIQVPTTVEAIELRYSGRFDDVRYYTGDTAE